jgi:hypothetical protein
MTPQLFSKLVPYILIGGAVFGLLIVVLLFWGIGKVVGKAAQESTERAAPQFQQSYPRFINAFQARVSKGQDWFPVVTFDFGAFPALLTAAYRVIPGAIAPASRTYLRYRVSVDIRQLPSAFPVYVANKSVFKSVGRVLGAKAAEQAQDIDLGPDEFGNAFVCKSTQARQARAFLNQQSQDTLFALLHLVSTTSIELWVKENKWMVEKRTPVTRANEMHLLDDEELIEFVNGCQTLFAAYQNAAQT